MTDGRLPDGFAVQIDRRVQVLNSGSALLGGTPVRLLRLSPTAAGLIRDGRVEVRDETSARLARTLLDATVAHPRPAGGPSYRDVTVVIPVRDNRGGLARLVPSLRGMSVIVVDDGSATPVRAKDLPGDGTADIRIVRHENSRGPAAARNTGLGMCDTGFVAFLDSDVLPQRGWLEALMGHFCDPAVAAVAPRITALDGDGSAIARYEAVRSSLDLGAHESAVIPYGAVSYVPSAAIVCRRSAVESIGGFDEALHSGEDVDLCWRLVDAGWRLRYEPVADVDHQHRLGLRPWLSRRAFYGGSAASLSQRHPEKTAPLLLSRWTLLAWVLPATGTPAGVLGGLLGVGLHTRRTAAALAGSGATDGQVALLTARGLVSAGRQLAAACCRHYWPLAAVGAVVSRRIRRLVLAAALLDGGYDWFTRARTAPEDVSTGPLEHLALKRLDDMAYGAGLWWGAIRARALRALWPEIK